MQPKITGFKRSISWTQGTAMTVGAVLGSGIFILPVTAAVMAGPASLISWILMGLLTIPLAVTLGALGTRYPDAGGIAAFAGRAFGKNAENITGWLFLGTVPIGAPIVALIGANYIGMLFNLSHGYIVLLAALMLAMALLFNYRGIELSGRIQVTVISLIVIVLMAVVIAAFPQVETKAFTPFVPHGWIPVGEAMTRLFWAFVGWEMIVHLSEEFKNPEKDLSLSLGLSIGIINLLYLSIAFVTIGAGSYMTPSGTVALSGMIEKGWGSWAGIITAVLAFIVCYGTVHTYVAGFSRLIYAQSRSGYFPLLFSKLHERYQVPHYALLALMPVFVIVLTVKYLWNFDIGVLIQWPGAVFIALYLIAMASAVKLLPKYSIGWHFAVLALVVCLIVYGFTRWVGLYPVVLGTVGWLVYRHIREKNFNILKA